MNQKSALVCLLLFAILPIVGVILYDHKYGHKFDKYLDHKDPVQNWQWDDQWGEKSKATPKEPTPQPQVTPQLIAGNYTEALQKSGETGKPVLVFFTAEWCQWCAKMKSETLPAQQVQSVLKNYILVYVDTDKDRSSARKFNVEGLPTYVISNFKEENLKAGNGFKNADSFSSWLNNPSLYNQPKQDKKTDDKKDEKTFPRLRPKDL